MLLGIQVGAVEGECVSVGIRVGSLLGLIVDADEGSKLGTSVTVQLTPTLLIKTFPVVAVTLMYGKFLKPGIGLIAKSF